MRVGVNPLRQNTALKQPERLTVATITFIPALTGYWEHSLDILKLYFGSLYAHTSRPFDLMVFDNGSCREVISYLQSLQDRGKVQFLILSDQNVGKAAAWGFLFGAAPGEYVAYADSDIYFCPGWLEAEMQILETFPNVGMVSGVPYFRQTFSDHDSLVSSTLKRVKETPEIQIERGRLIPEEWLVQWAESIGYPVPEEYVKSFFPPEQIRLRYKSVKAFVGATDFQFLARTSTMHLCLPLSSVVAVGSERILGEKVNHLGFMRLAVDGIVVQHIGNILTEEWAAVAPRLSINVSSRPWGVSRNDMIRGTMTRLARLRLTRQVAEFLNRQSGRVLYYGSLAKPVGSLMRSGTRAEARGDAERKQTQREATEANG